ncbi:MAG: chemotaxis protein CheA, partial [Desulfobacterales bacterium]|nr:chemotaxis protein CheA [Desulfobacterales bacterium]
ALEESTKTLQKIGLSLRMVPLKPLFSRMRRVARDLALKQNKKINFLVEGELTELDKTLVDGLADPLIHIIRNSIDHGVENDTTLRIQRGKPETATVTLKGYHEGGSLVIEVADDGAGIDRERLLEKATSAGIIDDPGQMDDAAVLHLIFHPGLSTAAKVTDISGRGVGMDVVKTTISEFNGRISLASEPGQGTRVSIKLPLTLAIMDGMIITSGSNPYVIPALSIITALRLTPDIHATAMGGHPYIKFREAIIPLVNLKDFMNLPDAEETAGTPSDPIVVVVEDGGRWAGLLVDEVVAKQSIVRKNLSGMLSEVPGISGATIMADGRVCLILDIQALVGAAHGQAL